MKKTFFTPGPSELYFTYEDHVRSSIREQIGAISHRSSAFQKLYQHSTEQLTELLNLPEGYRIVFVSSATECWERISQNLIKKSSHHYFHGDFGNRFYKTAASLKESVVGTQISDDFKPEKSSAELIALTMNETSTGFQHTTTDISEMRKLNPNALIALDIVTATPAIEIDFAQIDTAYFSIQKCFGLPAGLGVWILNEKAIAKAEEVNYPSYHSIKELLKMADKHQTPETPNVLSIYLLGKVAEDMLRRGIGAIRSETNYKAALLYQILEKHQKFSPAITIKERRSKTTIVSNCIGSSDEIISYLKNHGMIVGSGYGERKNSQIRIANFPAHSKEQMELLCDTLEKLG